MSCGSRRVGPEWRSGRSPATPVACWAPPYPTFSHLATHLPPFRPTRPNSFPAAAFFGSRAGLPGVGRRPVRGRADRLPARRVASEGLMPQPTRVRPCCNARTDCRHNGRSAHEALSARTVAGHGRGDRRPVISLRDVSYAVATIGSDDIINGSIRNRDFKDGTLAATRPSRTASGRSRSWSSRSTRPKLKQVPAAVLADGVTRQAVVSNVGATVRARGVASSAKSGTGQYVVVLDRESRSCAYFATLGDESASGPARARSRSRRRPRTSTACAWSPATATARWPIARSTCRVAADGGR